MFIICHLPDPPHFSLPTTFKSKNSASAVAVSNLEPRLEVEAEEEQRRDLMQQRHTQIDGFIKERMED
jgi:hypothetical protein